MIEFVILESITLVIFRQISKWQAQREILKPFGFFNESFRYGDQLAVETPSVLLFACE